MQLGDLKPVIAALVLPPTGPLLAALAGLFFARRHRLAAWLAGTMVVATLLLSCRWFAVLLAQALLPPVAPVQPAQLQQVQAIVVLGGGVEERAPEYGAPQLSSDVYQRLRYGAWLSRHSGKPIAYAGGVGWGNPGAQVSEAEVAQWTLKEDFGLPLRWQERRSRDTRENALFIAGAMRPDGIRRVAVVTDAWHMPRAVADFRAAGFDVLAAPVGFPLRQRGVGQWLPTPKALLLSMRVLREWLALQVARFHGATAGLP